MELNVALPHEMLVQEHQQTLMAEAEDARRRRALRDATRQEHRATIAALLRLVRLADGAERRRRAGGRQDATRTRTVPPCTSRTARSWLA